MFMAIMAIVGNLVVAGRNERLTFVIWDLELGIHFMLQFGSCLQILVYDFGDSFLRLLFCKINILTNIFD